MPGISLKIAIKEENVKTNGKSNNNDFLNGLTALLYNDKYTQEVLLEDTYLVACTRYPEYPIEIIETSEFWICVEGKIYNKTVSIFGDEIRILLKRIFAGTSLTKEDKNAIAEWLLTADGDFVIYALDKSTKDFVIINDVLGRLPFYYHYKKEKEITASREIAFLNNFIYDNKNGNDKFDKLGLAEVLLFSHTLGKRTLLSDIHRMEPASILKIYSKNLRLEIENIHCFNFQIKANTNVSTKDNANNLVSLFSEACKNRTDHNSRNIISLSGGFDSRAVAAGLYKNNLIQYAVTSTEPHWRPVEGATSESEIAEQIAKSLSIDWKDYGIKQPRSGDLIGLLNMKRGLTYLAHSFLLPFLKEVKETHDSTPINFFTGHGGDILFADSSYETRDLEHLVRNIIRVKGYLPLNDAATVVRVNESEIIEEIRKILNSYPEVNLGQKLAHYLFFESNIKFSFEIEDINRHYFWTLAPFYSIPFFKYIMNCPDEQKTKVALYREFLFNISPLLSEIKNSNWGCSILSIKFRFLQSLMPVYWRFSDLRRIIKKLKDKRGYSYRHNSKIIRCIVDQVTSCDSMSDNLSLEGINNIINNSTDYSHYALDNLFTVTSLVEQTLCKDTMIKKHYD